MVPIFTHRYLQIQGSFIPDLSKTYSHLDQFSNKEDSQLKALLSNHLFYPNFSNYNLLNSYKYVSKNKFESNQMAYSFSNESSTFPNSNLEDSKKGVPIETTPETGKIETIVLQEKTTEENTNDEEKIFTLPSHESVIQKVGHGNIDDEQNVEMTKNEKVLEENLEASKATSHEPELIIAKPITHINLKKKFSKKKSKNNKGSMFLLDKTSKLSEFNKWLLSLKSLEDSHTPEIKKLNKKRKKRLKMNRLLTETNASILNNERIVSEGLADILIKQGHYQKAIEMYEELSLNNPEKSGYFAAQIEQLKLKIVQ